LRLFRNTSHRRPARWNRRRLRTSGVEN